MCGITGYIGTDGAGEIIHEGLERLDYRGYDSAGIALVGEDLSVSKTAGTIDELPVPTAATARCGIGHTR